MFRIVTDASRSELEAAVGGTGLGNRKFHAQTRPAPGEPGLIEVSVPEWAATILTAALRRIDAWFDRAMPQGKVPRGKPVVSHGGASSVRNYDRRERKAARDRKAA